MRVNLSSDVQDIGCAAKKAHMTALASMASDWGPSTRVSDFGQDGTARPLVALAGDGVELDGGTAGAPRVVGEGDPSGHR